jgi:hypothetical protein
MQANGHFCIAGEEHSRFFASPIFLSSRYPIILSGHDFTASLQQFFWRFCGWYWFILRQRALGRSGVRAATSFLQALNTPLRTPGLSPGSASTAGCPNTRRLVRRRGSSEVPVKRILSKFAYR